MVFPSVDEMKTALAEHQGACIGGRELLIDTYCYIEDKSDRVGTIECRPLPTCTCISMVI